METLSCCLDGITLYQPVGSVPSANLQPWVDDGFLDIRIPFAGIVDQDLVAAGLTDWKTWGSLHHRADLAYFKEIGPSLSPVEPLTPRLTSEIKGTAGKAKDKTQDQDLTVQLFLLLAQDFDQQSWDIQEQLTNIDIQKRALEDFFHIDSPEQGDNLTSKNVFSQPKEDLGRLMTKTRLIAWNHLFQKAPAPSNVLISDSPAAVDFLLEDQEEKLEVLHLTVPPPGATERSSHKAHLASLFRDLLDKPWDDGRKRQVDQMNSQFLAMAPTRKPATNDLAAAKPAFHWHLVPHVDAKALLNKRCKRRQDLAENRVERNTLVGLLDTDSPGHVG